MDANRTAVRRGLYPPIEPYRTGMLDVGDGHSVYYEESGRPDGLPVVALHGGPGGGASPAMRRFFDPDRWRIIVFDQRGAGRSRPFADVRANDTWALIGDMERLREALRVDRWLVLGGSWGATLALSYALAHRDRVSGLVLRGVFTCAQRELDWFYRDGANQIYPDAWERLTGPLSKSEREDVLRAYHARVMHDDPETRRDDARAWARWESTLISLRTPYDGAQPDPRRADALARIETHYFVHGGFFPSDGYLLERAEALQGVPGAIVQGRYDLVTPPRTAWSLAKTWRPDDGLEIVPDAGHAAGEPGIVDALVRATDRFAGRFS